MGNRKIKKMLRSQIEDFTAYIDGTIEIPKFVVDVPDFINSCYERRAECIDQLNALEQSSSWPTIFKVGIPALATIAAALGGAYITAQSNKQIALSNQAHREAMADKGYIFESEGRIATSNTTRQITQIPKI